MRPVRTAHDPDRAEGSIEPGGVAGVRDGKIGNPGRPGAQEPEYPPVGRVIGGFGEAWGQLTGEAGGGRFPGRRVANQETLLRLTGRDATCCPRCKKGAMTDTAELRPAVRAWRMPGSGAAS